MTRRRRRAWSMLPLTVAASACAARGADDASVAMTAALRFEPAAVEIPVGGRVIWQNTGVTQHTATAIGTDREPTGAFDSGVVVGTGTYAHTFDEAGTFTYTCTIHGSEMVGLVTVVAG
ncbi:plastocyanin/azurin family copper-binding protein [Egicoccus sp. AB-alg6-2]|uniref:cupredoxin domain-containing protein n=1 Tax=Egicoccus sp. AB-alg6-2 TaxID=3242692 RepID=UPI00359D70EC